MLPMPQTRRERALLLATGQITSYGSGTGVDDGALKKGIVKAYSVLTAGQYSGTTNITINGKTDAHSNNCVEDHNTGFMWSRYPSASVGPGSDGKLPWTTNVNGEGIFSYCAAANAAELAGYSDWRVPNSFSLESLRDMEAANASPNSSAFPTMGTTVYLSSSTTPTDTTKASYIEFNGGQLGAIAKTSNFLVILVRGGR